MYVTSSISNLTGYISCHHHSFFLRQHVRSTFISPKQWGWVLYVCNRRFHMDIVCRIYCVPGECLAHN